MKQEYMVGGKWQRVARMILIRSEAHQCVPKYSCLFSEYLICSILSNQS